MVMSRMAEAARRRIRDNAAREGDEGFMLVYVLLITTIVTVLVGSTLVVASGNVIPSVKAGNDSAAYSAAQGGLQAFLAYADTNCSGVSASISACTLPSTDSGDVVIYPIAPQTDTYTAKYHWKAVKGTAHFRVTSTGTITMGTLTSKKTLVADVAGGTSSNTRDYGVVTTYETQPPDVVLSQFPARTIALNSTAVSNAGLPAGNTSVTWAGATSGLNPGTVNVCNGFFYGSTGRVNNAAPSAPSQYVDWSESGTVGSNSYTDYQPCQVSLGHSTKLLGPTNSADGTGGYSTKDALLLSNGYPGGTGPLLQQPVVTGFKYNSATDGNCGITGENYREFNLSCAGYPVNVGGSPAAASTYTPTYTDPTSLPSPPTGSPTIPSNACVYNGPTRVNLGSDGSATITSPQTTATWVANNASTRPAACYTNAGTNGMQLSVVTGIASVANGVIYAQNDGTAPATPATYHTNTGWNTTGQRYGDTASQSNTDFYLSAGTPPTTTDTGSTTQGNGCTSSTLYSAANSAACSWTNAGTTTDGNGAGTKGWTSYSGSSSTTCSGLAQTNRQQFECDFGGGSVTSGHDNYSTYRSRVITDLNTGSCLTGTQSAQLTCLGSLLTGRTPFTQNVAAHTGYRYIISASAAGTPVTSTKTLSTNAAPATGDAFFDSSAVPGSSTVETDTVTPMTFTVSRQVYACYGVLGLLSCLLGGTAGWGDGTNVNASTPQFTVTLTQSTWAITQAGSAGASYFPSMSDVTQYGIGTGGANGTNGPGNVFVEGTATGTLAVVAQNDVIVTGSLAVDSTAHAIEVVARDNVRIYHPVSCASTTGISATTPGFCPNDITGLYSGTLTNGARPSQQYTNLRPDLANLSINAAVYALGNAPTTVSCPRLNSAGTCGGTFTTDNYNRGDSVGTTSLGTLTLAGSVAMVHHGALGEEWEIADATGQASRPYTGYQFTDRYQNLKTAIASVPNVDNVLKATSTTSSLWRIVSVSTGASS